jgi:hypothetical protein
MPMSVGIFTAQVLQDVHLTDIRAQRAQSTPTAAAAAEMCRNAVATRRVSKQRSAGASDPNDSAHQGECECHSGQRPVRAVTHRVHYAATSTVARFPDVGTPVGFPDTSHTASCHRAQSEADVD